MVGPGCWKAEKTKILVWQREVCSVERMEMSFSSEVEETQPSGGVPGPVLGGRTEKCFTDVLQ